MAETYSIRTPYKLLVVTVRGEFEMPVELHWTSAAPLEVQMLIDPKGRNDSKWVFARTLLTQGLWGRAGIGDVIVDRSRRDNAKLIEIAVRVDGWTAVVLIDRLDLLAFLAVTWRQAPETPDSAPIPHVCDDCHLSSVDVEPVVMAGKALGLCPACLADRVVAEGAPRD